MQNSPFLSIIIPVYNVEKYLQKCLQSISIQTFRDFEVILVNDGSIDCSQSICERMCEIDSRFQLINQSNAGAGSARNNGIKYAKGTYICFIDSDDWIEPYYLMNLISNCDNYDITFWGYTIDYPDRSEEHHLQEKVCHGLAACNKAIYDLKIKCEYGFTCTCLLRSDIIKDNNILFPTNIQLHEDIVFINKYCIYIRSLRIIDNIGYHYMKLSATSLSRRYISHAEANNIANEVFESSRHWHTYKPIFSFELQNYLNWLIISVVNIYSSNVSLLPRRERVRYIKNVIALIRQYNFTLSKHPKGRMFIFKLRNPFIVDLLYRIIRFLRH